MTEAPAATPEPTKKPAGGGSGTAAKETETDKAANAPSVTNAPATLLLLLIVLLAGGGFAAWYFMNQKKNPVPQLPEHDGDEFEMDESEENAESTDDE